ncbi:hypothetical protein RC62_4086 [Flavobacterium aquidurense]|uniref:Uncharacterized protein n=1 Tax=Flavobacterium aquidurense TaxID=362413 RepID=A0A0N8VN75_9FLAO|nr:hypothetical protein RC62_4086 [Flavobacterium aquidurense]
MFFKEKSKRISPSIRARAFVFMKKIYSKTDMIYQLVTLSEVEERKVATKKKSKI